MGVNLTLIVQIIHWAIAYLILTRIFFRPAWSAYRKIVEGRSKLLADRAHSIVRIHARKESIVYEKKRLFSMLREQIPVVKLPSPQPVIEKTDQTTKSIIIAIDKARLVAKIVNSVER